MPYVAPTDTVSTLRTEMAAIRSEKGPAPWRVPLVGTDQRRCVLLAYPPGHRTVPHHHPHAVETFLVVDGRGTFEIGEEAYSATPGTLLWSPVGVQHTITADRTTDLVFLACV